MAQETHGTHRISATKDDRLRIAGVIDKRKEFDILALRPTTIDLEEAAVRAAGDGNLLGRGSHPFGRCRSVIRNSHWR